ncbi:pimeloyl-ACP methyl ester carboxylesterase [Leucobacter exalbidus]|uniref:Pimeloyl-ACP methyl ester carboxylesterase n=1 Tax=Leucobacter exalbidus TaxID=662960 RepID=A0A940PP39_9MICO|nr:alpha/beta hydrolase [Leucobacter exalbidus]MBP1326605.1 pimeloyl-ACP methyl ester carboxylesterase [Leucobacter exalbidus]
MNASSKLLLIATARTTGLRKVHRPATDNSPAFDLAYVRTGPRTSTPTVIIPGGPGLGSVLPYRRLRRLAARGGLDLIMVEHRGVGRSRTDLAGHDLPVSAMWVTEAVDDIAAVLDREGVRTAFIAGSSYGSYLASSFGARHGDRVAGMLLDSALQSASDHDLEREVLRDLLWEGNEPLPTLVHELAATGIDERELLDVVRAAYELCGATFLTRLLRRRIRHRGSLTWKLLASYATRDASIAQLPGIYEFDLVGAIGFRELGYGAPRDGRPLDPALTYGLIADQFPPFAHEPFDLQAQAANFSWPLVLLTGARDLRTPTAIARRVAAAAPDAVLVEIDNGHSALDTHPVALLNAIRRLVNGQQEQLPADTVALNQLPKRGISARFPALLQAALAVERFMQV